LSSILVIDSLRPSSTPVLSFFASQRKDKKSRVGSPITKARSEPNLEGGGELTAIEAYQNVVWSSQKLHLEKPRAGRTGIVVHGVM
jgi:hypothetical protein